MLTKPQLLIIEQATAKAGGKLSFEQKKSTRTTAVYFVRASNRPDAIKNTIINTGSALMITTTVLVSGFSILVLSAFLPTYQFGLLSSGMIGAALICDLTLLPALCLILPNPNKE